jgi:hypothetical protein
VTYRIARHADRSLPVIRWSEVSIAAPSFARERGFLLRKGSGPDLDQAGLERWL